ncbi:MAG: hypothetical protein JXR85_09835 [Deltaproteobacteria bacterium]|nr:hypothetical protein [Deltaproteobacteria bacterium]
MLSELIIVIIALAAVMLFFWISAGRIYESHHSTKKNHPFLFKLTGFNEKHLDDREKWVRHFRLQLILISVLFLCVLWVVAVGR